MQAIGHGEEVEATVLQMEESGYSEVLQTPERLCQQVNLQLEVPRPIARQRFPDDVAGFTVEGTLGYL